MKKSLILSVLGLALLPTPSANALWIYFDTYNGPTLPVTYALTDVPEGMAGQVIDGSFSAALYAGLGNLTDPSQLTLVPGSITPFSSGPWDQGYVRGSALLFEPSSYYFGPVTLMFVAWKTSGPYGESFFNFNPTFPVLQGCSPLWTEEMTMLNVNMLENSPTFAVQIVPEPGVMTVLGLGLMGACARRASKPFSA
jgi:hypothetical protein